MNRSMFFLGWNQRITKRLGRLGVLGRACLFDTLLRSGSFR